MSRRGGPTERVDAVVIGSGPNGLVAANALVDAGWSVVLLETEDTVGGAVRSADDVTAPGFTTDLFSAFYPLAAASPVIRGLDLQDHGLQWSQAPVVLAHPLADGRVAVLEHSADDTAAGLDSFAAGDGAAWTELVAQWADLRDPLLDALFTPFPPIRAATRVLQRARVRGTLDLARLAVMPIRHFAQERFTGDGGPLLLTGNALHSDVPAEAAGSGIFGWLLSMLAQDVGFPVPVGGAGQLAQALRRRFESVGGQVRTGTRVTDVLVTGGRAIGVRTAGGTTIGARAVLADVSAPSLYRSLLDRAVVPPRLLADLRQFRPDTPTLKLNWALDRPVPWSARGARGAGTVHFGVDVDGFVDYGADLTVGRAPRNPFVLFGQMTTADSSRSPAGTESAWAYTHLPSAVAGDPAVVARQVARVEEQLEELAPGFGGSVIGRLVQSPADLESADANLLGGSVNGGTAYLHQQLFFRPTVGLGRAETPIAGLYLASAAAHPGGGVHGACGWNAALSAIRDAGPWGQVRKRLTRTAWGRILPR